MVDIKFNFDLSFQLQVLFLMFKDEGFLLKCKKVFKEEYFENDYLGYFYKKVVNFSDRYEKLPDVTYYVNEIKKIEPKKQEEYIQFLHKILSSEPVSSEYIKEQLEDFIKRNTFVRYYEKLPELYSVDPEKAYQYSLQKSEEIFTFKFDDDDEILTLDSHEDFAGVDDGEAIRLGIPEIDMALGGGVFPGDLVTWLGDSGVGKSIILILNGVNALLQGKKVFHINLEGRKEIPINRYLSCITGIPYNTIKTSIFDNEEQKKKYLKAREMYRGQLYVIHMGSFKVTIEDIYAKCKEIHKRFSFDVFIVDYGDLLSTKQQMELRHQQTAVFRGLSKIAGIFKIPVITGTQATRPEGAFNSEHFYLSQRNVSESYEKVRVSSIILSLNRTEKEELENKLRIMVCKNREGQKWQKVGCYSNYSQMKPYSVHNGFYNPRTEILSEGSL